MKLSEILGWEKKAKRTMPLDLNNTAFYVNDFREWNTALTACDREIDREALAKIVYGLKSVFKNPNHYSLKEQEKMALDDVETIISTMPTWLKRSDGE